MLNAACLSRFSVPCHRYHLTQELFRGQLFQAIESRSKPALGFSDSLQLTVQVSFSLLSNSPGLLPKTDMGETVSYKYDLLIRVVAIFVLYLT